ncbi:cobalamin biosynthesis protein CbiX [Sinirhodobacter populi]|uniref:Cobalamin biosynthesis protein CbiX n=1 Tax=Paenirhodobacter populi TaxID=2306993 RepID=A0A443KEE9_9RHOB|nr:CbiX/SirB N-terminal domain-containing protein [Sinirhodobacter populi]RWR31075.1 cobalamin biosynthesis protein CbiX [Sinirhodobacter populi]
MTQAVLVAHGSPSDPVPPDRVLRDLAARVQALLPGVQVRAGTLAMPGSFEAALAGCDDPLIYPFFMAEGWFTRRELPRRIAAAGARGRILPPFGLEPDLPDLIRRTTLAATEQAGMNPQSADLILVAHGSRSPGRAKEAPLAMAATLARITPFAAIRPAFIEEAPFVADVARGVRGLCLPFFALRASHVGIDIPAALQEAGFSGPLLPAIGEHPEVAAIIARGLGRALLCYKGA